MALRKILTIIIKIGFASGACLIVGARIARPVACKSVVFEEELSNFAYNGSSTLAHQK
jgi:hypothetical protein